MDQEVKRKIGQSFDDLWELIEIERPEKVAGLRHMMRAGWIFAIGEFIAAERARCAAVARDFTEKYPNDYGYTGAKDIAAAIRDNR